MPDMDQSVLQAIAQCIEAAHRVLVVAHVAPDGDAIGSVVALGRLLEAQGKEPILACEDPVPQEMAFLPGSERLVQQVDGPVDLVISLDCSDMRRMGSVGASLWPTPSPDEPAASSCTGQLINIDHHVTNVLFGTVNWVDPDSVATAQMVLTLADALGWELDPETATCLLTGLVTDTRAFRTTNVTEAAVLAALRLMRAGASLPHITRQALDFKPLGLVRLWGEAMSYLQLANGILWTEVTADMRRRCGLEVKDVSGLANFLAGVREAQVVIVFTERDKGEIDVSMRSAPGVDVSLVALSLGGGGHPQASGTTLQGTLPDVREQVLAAVRFSLAEQGAAG